MVSCEAYLTGSRSNSCEVGIFGLVLFFLSLFLSPASVFAGGNPSAQLQIPIGASNVLGNGDYISNTGGRNTYFSYFIEVTPGLSSLHVDIFDADIGGANDLIYNGAFDTTATYTLFDPNGKKRPTVFTFGDATHPAGADSAWLNFFTSGSGTGNYVRDNFSTAAYTNNDGNNNWATNWAETDTGGGGAGGGNIRVTGGQLRMTGTAPNANYIIRTVDLSATGLNLTTANLTFDYSTSGNWLLNGTDSVAIQASTSSGGTWTTLQTFNTNASGTFNQNISAYISNTTAIRFIVTNTLEGGGNPKYFYVDNVQIGDDGGPATPGHWEFRMDMSGAAGDDYNGFAVRAHDGNSGAGGTEVNMYAKSFVEFGVLGATTLAENIYPYISSGCTFNSNDFDSDSATTSTTIAFTSRTGDFNPTIPTASLSISGAWKNNPVTGWTNDVGAYNYGIWGMQANVNSVTAGNMISYWIGDFVSGTTAQPTAQPQPNSFRMYLPTDAVAAPVKPYVIQTLGFVSGQNPPSAGLTTRVKVEINVINPTPWPITFSATNLVTANVPGGGAVYAGNAAVSQGSITAQPGIGGTGNITWNPVTVAAGATATLTYLVDVTPPGAGTVSVTGTPASNGTTAKYVDETGNTTQALATYTFGPLCQLAVTTGTSLPTLAVISSFDAYEENAQVVVEWKTASEVGTVGFYLLRQDKETGDFRQINKRLLPGLINSPQGGTYRLVDHGASLSEGTTYKLIEIESSGNQRAYGPFSVGTDSRQFALKSPQKADRTVLYKPEVLSEGTVSHYTRVSHGISEAQTNRIKARKEAQKAVQVLTTGSVGGQAKISVREAGLYYLKASDISVVLGLSEQRIKDMIRQNLLSLSAQGQKVAYIADDGYSGIYFYGRGIDSIYTRKNIYWLKKDSGLVMLHVEGNGPSPAAANETFSETLHFEKDLLDAPGLFQDPNADYWFWDYIAGGDPEMGSKNFTLRTNGAASVPDQASITIRLHGASDSGVTNEHHAIFTLNGTEIGETLWEGAAQEDHTVTLSFSQEILNDGDNTLEVTGVLGPGVPYSIFFINSFDLTYQRLYQAVGNALLLRGDTNQVVSVSGFTNPDILLFEVTTSNTPKLINATTIDGTDGNYRLSFNPASSGSVYLAISRDALKVGTDMWADTPSSLKDKNNKADYLVITTSGLSGAAQSLAAYRKGQGFAAMVVNQEDIMDEFNYGIYSPKATRDFLSYAYKNWKKAPKYVVLGGDGSYDYKDNLGYGDSLIPPMMAGTPDGLFPSDNSLADFNGDRLPEIAIGRLPVSTPQELQGMIDKIIAYETASIGVWGKGILMLADVPEEGGAFTDESDQLAALLPPKYSPVRIYLSEHPLDEARLLLLNEINNGVGAMNYIGHGGLDRLSSGGLLVTGDIDSMINTGKYPIVTAMTCIVGQFSIPGYDSLAEGLVLKPKGGAVAVWAPTGISIDSEAVILDRMFFQHTFREGNRVLGDIIVKALKDYGSEGTEPYMMDIYNLLGDPALKIRSK